MRDHLVELMGEIRQTTVKGFTFRANTLAKQKSFAETLAKAKEWIGVARQLAEDVGNSKI